MGASFCHVSRIIPGSNGVPWVTSGTQKWNGASPIFMVMEMVIICAASGLEIFMIVHWPEYMKLIITAIIRSADAVVCTRKYLVAASVDRGLCFSIRMGIIANMFISRPIQAGSQCELSVVIIVPENSVNIIMLRVAGLISMGRI